MSIMDSLSSLSESQGVDDIDHRVFVITNENNQQKTLKTLQKQPLCGNMMMGVSGFCVLNMAAVRGDDTGGSIEYLLLIDNSLRVQHFWSQVEKIILGSDKRCVVENGIMGLLEREKERYFSTPGYDRIATAFAEAYQQKLGEEIIRGDSWLSTDVRFSKIRKIFTEGRCLFKRLDVCDFEHFQSLGKWMTENFCKLDTIYLSNVLEYVNTAQRVAQFIKGIDAIIGKETFIITTRPRCHPKCPLQQVVIRIREGGTFFAALSTPIKLVCPNNKALSAQLLPALARDDEKYPCSFAPPEVPREEPQSKEIGPTPIGPVSVKERVRLRPFISTALKWVALVTMGVFLQGIYP